MEAKEILKSKTYDVMTFAERQKVADYEIPIWTKRVDKLTDKTLDYDKISDIIHDWWLDYEISDETEKRLLQYAEREVKRHSMAGTLYCEEKGIIPFKITKGHVVYYANYPAYIAEPRRTYKITVNLDTKKEESRVLLKRWNAAGEENRYR